MGLISKLIDIKTGKPKPDDDDEKVEVDITTQ